MRVEQNRTELQVMDYMTWPVVKLAQHPNFDQTMFEAVVKVARMTRYEFDGHMTVYEVVNGLSYNQKTQLRDFFRDTFDKYLPI